MPITCQSCKYYKYRVESFGDVNAVVCDLTDVIVNGDKACDCKLYNKDISSYNICYNCKHFLGGSDWGLSCAKEYNRLTDALKPACNDFEGKR